MDHKIENSHHLGPIDGYQIHHFPIDESHFADCPVTYPYDVTPEPGSEPIRQMHTHDVMEIGYCYSGAGILAVEDRIVHFSAGDISIVGEHQIHMSQREANTPCHWTYFWLDHRLLLAGMPDGLKLICVNLFANPDFPYIFSPANHPRLCTLVREVVEELKIRPYGHRSVARSMTTTLLILLSRLYRDDLQRDPLPSREGIERVVPALHYMASHYTDPIESQVLAKLCSLSVSHFRRVFLCAIGKTPLEYLGQLRSRMAAALLIGSKTPISLIAYKVGFESINTFNRQFRSHIGMTPREWRQQGAKQ